MPRAFAMYNLKPGVTMEQYRQFSREIDQKITPTQPHVQRFEVYEIKGRDQGKPPYQILEVIDVDSFEGWIQTTQGEGMKKVVEEWNKLCDPSSMVHIWGEKI